MPMHVKVVSVNPQIASNEAISGKIGDGLFPIFSCTVAMDYAG
jgi:hypothetical protein